MIFVVLYNISIDFLSTVVGLSVKEGGHVTMGQPLTTIDMSEYLTSVEKLEQQLLINEAGLKTATQDTSSLKSKQVQLSQTESANSVNLEKQNSSIAASQIDLDNMKNKSVKAYLHGNQIISCVDNGIVQNIKVNYGARLGTQNVPTSVLQLIDADSIVIHAEIDEEFIRNVNLGESVKIIPEFYDTFSMAGTVTQISNISIEKDGKRKATRKTKKACVF